MDRQPTMKMFQEAWDLLHDYFMLPRSRVRIASRETRTFKIGERYRNEVLTDQCHIIMGCDEPMGPHFDHFGEMIAFYKPQAFAPLMIPTGESICAENLWSPRSLIVMRWCDMLVNPLMYDIPKGSGYGDIVRRFDVLFARE